MKTPRHIGQVININPEDVNEYKRLHAKAWPTVLARISKSNIRNYSIFLKEPENILFAYMEYVGDDFEADMQALASDPETQRWWGVVGPMQRPFASRQEGEWWANMEAIFHHE